jgi:hypothetical protein
VRPLYTTYSDRISAFQVPPQATTLPVTSDGMHAGITSLRWISPRDKPSERSDSRRSSGTFCTPERRLNSRYHCMPVSASAIEMISMPPKRSTRSATRMGKNPVAGIEAPTCETSDSARIRRG